MRADLVIRTEHHKGAEVQQYPSVYKAAFHMVQLSAALGVDVKGFVNGISDESKQSIDDLSTLHTPVSPPRNEAIVLGENFEGWFF